MGMGEEPRVLKVSRRILSGLPDLEPFHVLGDGDGASAVGNVTEAVLPPGQSLDALLGRMSRSIAPILPSMAL
jgi:hypothetical protein